MAVTLLYFSTLRTRAGTARESLDLPEPISVARLRQILAERHPALAVALPSSVVAVNHDFAFDESIIADGDEVALFPPVSGGASPGPTVFHLTQDPIEFNELLAALTLPTTGAACVFTGVVRGETERGAGHSTAALRIRGLPPDGRSQDAPGGGGDPQALAVGGGHRHRAAPRPARSGHTHRADRLHGRAPRHGVFEAARYGIDRLKQIVPVWKKEIGPDGEVWVEGDYTPQPEDRRP